MLVEALAGLLLAAVVAYALLGGADFGGGLWDLLARGPRKEQQREAIAHAMGPVWEANHVWLIFVITILFTAFPDAYAVLSRALFLPFHVVLLGIILRGAAFVFRSYGPPMGVSARQWGRIFGVASLVTPFMLGMAMGAITSGDLRVGPDATLASDAPAWLTLEAVAVGLLAVAACAYLAAVYLTLETRGDLQGDFRRRALEAWGGLVVLGLLAIPLLATTAPHLLPALDDPRALLVLGAGGLAAGVALWALLRRRFVVARAAAAAQVALMIAGWGLVQHPYLIYPDLTLAAAASPDPVLVATLWIVGIGTLLLAPSLWLLFRVFKGHLPGVSGEGDEAAVPRR